jgi:hypothetical protein
MIHRIFYNFEINSIAVENCAQPPNGLRYRRLGRKRRGNGKWLKFRKSPKKRGDSQPSGAPL